MEATKNFIETIAFGFIFKATKLNLIISSLVSIYFAVNFEFLKAAKTIVMCAAIQLIIFLLYAFFKYIFENKKI